MSETADLQRWMNKATGFELLGMAFLLPTKQLGEVVSSGEFGEACVEVLQALGADESVMQEVGSQLDGYRGADADTLFHTLRVEYTRLFVGEKIPPITPYAGVHDALERGRDALLFVTRESMDIERFMHRCGVRKNLAAGQTNDPLDHIGTMCEFCKFLCLVKAQAVVPSLGADVHDDDYQVFVTEHFAPYVVWMADQVDQQTRQPFFRAAALMLQSLIALP